MELRHMSLVHQQARKTLCKRAIAVFDSLQRTDAGMKPNPIHCTQLFARHAKCSILRVLTRGSRINGLLHY